ncbi:hypothetical protein [Dinoroseobacter sp. S124A]|uniref:hypothetical protein n=1 Tax=Dinoroseobacter sp. S124A TaxID=3415128 RepID=UPI003C7AD3C8
MNNFHRRYNPLLTIIVCTALPATSAYLLYQYTDNPTLRPLGITKEQLVRVPGEASSIAIRVSVDWGRDQPDGPSKNELHNIIANTLFNFTDDFVIKFRDMPGADVGVSFTVGANSYGPFTPDRMLDGIIPSLMAWDATKTAHERRAAAP